MELISENIKKIISGSVFPVAIETVSSFGLTKRELFASMAMQGIMADPNVVDPIGVASLAVECADALIKELNKE